MTPGEYMSSYKQMLEKIADMQHEAEALRKQELASVISEVKNKIAEYGLSAADLGLSGGKTKGKSATGTGTVSIKYRDSHGNTWTGRGKQPRWLVQALSAGHKIEEFLVKA
jgi:DNA-binding protein H-NS